MGYLIALGLILIWVGGMLLPGLARWWVKPFRGGDKKREEQDEKEGDDKKW